MRRSAPSRLRLPAAWALVLLIPFWTGCGPVDPGAEASAPHSLETDPGMLRALKTITLVEAEGVTGYHGVPFHIEERRGRIRGYPCSACHIDPLAALEPSLIDARTMHLNIQLQHAAAEVMDCRSCHHPEQLNSLQLQNGQSIPLEQAHLLCGQCHFEQLRDWAGGAHGKRLAGWRGLRAVKACTSCHDPHRPAFEEQWPVAYPRLPGTPIAEGAEHGRK